MTIEEATGCSDDIGAWLRTRVLPLGPLDSGDSPTDWTALRHLIGDARIVAIGEATHGTHEFFALRRWLTQFLIQEMGFTWLAIEAAGPECNRLGAYVATGEGDPAELVAGLGYWTWNTLEMLDVVRWLRACNQARCGADRLHLSGFDMQLPRLAIDQVLAYIHAVDPAAFEHFAACYEPFIPYVTTPYSYRRAAQRVKVRCRKRLRQARADLLSRRLAYESRLGTSGFAAALQDARLVEQAEDVFALGKGRRDRYMAENVAWLLDHAEPGAGMVVWAHNAHVGMTSDGASASMGDELRSRYGDCLVTVGAAFYGGAFNAVGMAGEPRHTSELNVYVAPPPSLDSYENALAQIDLRGLVIDLRHMRAPDTPAWLHGPHPLRMVGAVYDEAEPQQYEFPICLPQTFDLLAYIRDTSPSVLLA